MSVTDQDRERVTEIVTALVDGSSPYPDLNSAIAAALAAERERARAPFLTYADECAAIGADPKAGILKRAFNRSVAQAIHRAADRKAVS